MAKITRLPDRSPRVTTRTYSPNQGVRSYPSPKEGGFEGFRLTPDKPANKNVPRATREAAIRAKYPATGKGLKINSGKYAYGPKAPAGPSMASKVAGTVGRGLARGALRAAGTVGRGLARGALRAAGPVGALVGMTEPAGAPKGHPAYESPSIMKGKSYGPLMRGAQPSKSTGPSRGPTSAPVRTAPSRSANATGGGFMGPPKGTPTGGSSRFSGPSGPPRSVAPSRPSSGPTSAPSRTQPSRSNLGTSRFAKGGAIKRRKK